MRPSERLNCSRREVALFLMLGEALRRLPPEKRKIWVDDYEIEKKIKGWAAANYHFGLHHMDEKKFKRIWRVTWKNRAPSMEYVETESQKSRVFDLQ